MRSARSSRSCVCRCAFAVSLLLGSGWGSTQVVSFTGAPGGDWLTATNWSPNVVPNNGIPVNAVYHAVNASTVIRGSGVQVFIGELTNSGTVSMFTDLSLDAPGPGASVAINNSGTISIQPATSTNAVLGTHDNLTLSGGGTIVLGGAGTARIIGSGTLNNVNNRIIGKGTIAEGALRLTNSGTIISSGDELTINFKDNFQNTGRLSAASLSTLNLGGSFGSTLFNNGAISGDGGTVRLATIRIEGGTFSTSNDGTVQIASQDVFLDAVANEGRMVVLGSGRLNLETVFTNAGSTTVQGAIFAGGSITTSGGGTIFLSNGSLNAAIGGGTFINASNTIRGNGVIGGTSLAFTNQEDGRIVAENGTLTISPGPGGFSSVGMMRVASGATLSLSGHNGGTFDNTGGSIVAGVNSRVLLLGNAQISGGTFEAADDSGRFEVPTLSAALLKDVFAEAPLNVVGQLVVDGYLDGSGEKTIRSNAILSIRDNASLGSSAAVILEPTSTVRAEPRSRFGGPEGEFGPTLTNDGTLAGAGNLGTNTLRIVNNGTIIANAGISGAPLPLNIDPSADGLLNAGIIETRNFGRAILTGNQGGIFSQTLSGTIRAQGNGNVQIQSNAFITGGRLGAGTGTISIIGPITIESLDSDANIVQSGGSTLLLNLNVINTGTITTPGGATLAIAGSSTLNSGAGYLANTGSIIVNSSGHLDADFIEGTGRVQLNSNSTAAIHAIRQGTLSIGSAAFASLKSSFAPGVDGSEVNSLSIGAGGAALDLTNRGIAINYTGGSPVGTVAGWIASGYNAGAWNGPGIRSNNAATNPTLGIGFAEATAVGSPATFLGVEIDSTEVLIRTTLYGDADLNGTVNLNDFTRLASTFGGPSTWATGDFNYSGTTTLDDFTRLAANFGLSLSADELVSRVIPEPMSLPLAVLISAFVRPRRRKRQIAAGS